MTGWGCFNFAVLLFKLDVTFIFSPHKIIRLQINCVQLTSDVREAEALGLSGAVGMRVEVEPNAPPGGDDRWRQHGATQPGFPIPCRGEEEPVAQTIPRLGQVKVAETGAEHRCFLKNIHWVCV